MSDLLAARAQMATSLAFHILFAVAGIAMPVLMVVAEWRWRRSGDPLDLDLAKRWSKGTAILFAVGAVSGTVLSFELGLLWPSFMEYAGPIIGMPFSLEGFAFFTEAIFLGIYLYGWDRISPRAHLASGVLVAVSGIASGIFVVIANAWMNAPVGFRIVNGRPADIDPLGAMMTPAAFTQTTHMTLAAFSATAIAVAGIHAWFVRRDPDAPFHRRALSIALLVAIPSSLAQPVVGHWSAQHVARHQPAPDRRGRRPRPGPARGLAERAHRAHRLPAHGGHRHVAGVRLAVGRVGDVAAQPVGDTAPVAARPGGVGPPGPRRDRGRLGRHRGRAPAVDRPRARPHRRRRHPGPGAHRAVRDVHAAVRRARRRRGLAALPPDRAYGPDGRVHGNA